MAEKLTPQGLVVGLIPEEKEPTREEPKKADVQKEEQAEPAVRGRKRK